LGGADTLLDQREIMMSNLQINGVNVTRTITLKCTSDIIYQTTDGRVYVDADVGYITEGGVFPAGRLEAPADRDQLVMISGRCKCPGRGTDYCIPLPMEVGDII
jgi:hypothetical protein